jgi:hypothetical protein
MRYCIRVPMLCASACRMTAKQHHLLVVHFFYDAPTLSKMLLLMLQVNVPGKCSSPNCLEYRKARMFRKQ